jgi:hypothetical protein
METPAPTGHCGGDHDSDHGDEHGGDGDHHHHEEQEQEEEEEQEEEGEEEEGEEEGDGALLAWNPAPGGLAVTLSEAGTTVSCAPGSALWWV